MIIPPQPSHKRVSFNSLPSPERLRWLPFLSPASTKCFLVRALFILPHRSFLFIIADYRCRPPHTRPGHSPSFVVLSAGAIEEPTSDVFGEPTRPPFKSITRPSPPCCSGSGNQRAARPPPSVRVHSPPLVADHGITHPSRLLVLQGTVWTVCRRCPIPPRLHRYSRWSFLPSAVPASIYLRRVFGPTRSIFGRIYSLFSSAFFASSNFPRRRALTSSKTYIRPCNCVRARRNDYGYYPRPTRWVSRPR